MTLAIVRAIGLVTVQDLGRHGHMHEAVPPGGALVPELAVRANRLAGNADDVPVVEVCGRLVVRAEAALAVATDRIARTLAVGEELAIESEPRRVTYFAIRGGVEAPLILGGRGTLLCAGIGGLLCNGDRLRPGRPLADTGHGAPDTGHGAPDTGHGAPDTGQAAPDSRRGASDSGRAAPDTIRVVPGPDSGAFAPDALSVLVGAPYRVLPASDRVGTRLEGPAIPRLAGYVETSRPMVIGAIEVPADGKPIVLGPEHPTTGGYPLIAVVASVDLGRLFATRIGATVRFAQYV